jgi:hypothetical protein
MIDDIKSKNAENMALITMIIDEITGLYQNEGNGRLYEINRLENSLVTSIYMIDKRVQDINELVDIMLEKEAKGDS